MPSDHQVDLESRSNGSRPGPSTGRLPTAPVRVVVLASGAGTLLQALIDDPAPSPYAVVGVGADRNRAAALDRATAADIRTFQCRIADFADRDLWNVALVNACRDLGAEIIVCAGFMKLLGPAFLSAFPERVINSHPSLLPAFPGMAAPAEALAHGVKITGCTIFTVDGGIDAGTILAQQSVPVLPTDDVESLHERIKVAERVLLVRTVRELTEAIAIGRYSLPPALPPMEQPVTTRKSD